MAGGLMRATFGTLLDTVEESGLEFLANCALTPAEQVGEYLETKLLAFELEICHC